MGACLEEGRKPEHDHDCQKWRSVIKKPRFIFNAQPDSDLRYCHLRRTLIAKKPPRTKHNTLARVLDWLNPARFAKLRRKVKLGALPVV